MSVCLKESRHMLPGLEAKQIDSLTELPALKQPDMMSFYSSLT